MSLRLMRGPDIKLAHIISVYLDLCNPVPPVLALTCNVDPAGILERQLSVVVQMHCDLPLVLLWIPASPCDDSNEPVKLITLAGK
jgi:hypothetical protein